jgi:hypothetical protein
MKELHMETKISAAESNKAFFGLLEQGNVKQAQDMVTDFTRIRIRESSFFEKIMPSVKISDDELTPQLGTDKNVKLVEREPGSPAAVTIPLGSQPVQYYFRGDRYPVFFDRIVTPKFTKDVSELRTYGMDIRQVISDNAILDMDFEFDRKMLAAVQSIVGAEGSTVPETGVIQNKKIVDPLGITRNSLFEIKKILPSTFAHLDGVTILVNNITIHDISKFGRDEVGGDLSETMFVEGFQQKRVLGLNWVVTNKTELVSDNEFWVFASPEFMGKSLVLEDVTMFLDKRAFNLEFFSYCERGATIGNPASVARARIATS